MGGRSGSRRDRARHLADARRSGRHGQLARLGRPRRARRAEVVLRHLRHPRQPHRHERQRRDVREAEAVGHRAVRPVRGRRPVAGALPAGRDDRADRPRVDPERREEPAPGVQAHPGAAGGRRQDADRAVGLEPDGADLQQGQGHVAAGLVRGAARPEVQGPRRLQRPARVHVAGRRVPARLPGAVQDEQGPARQGQGHPDQDQAQRADDLEGLERAAPPLRRGDGLDRPVVARAAR